MACVCSPISLPLPNPRPKMKNKNLSRGFRCQGRRSCLLFDGMICCKWRGLDSAVRSVVVSLCHTSNQCMFSPIEMKEKISSHIEVQEKDKQILQQKPWWLRLLQSQNSLCMSLREGLNRVTIEQVCIST